MAETVLGAIANARFKTGMFKAEKWILVVTDQRLLGARLSDEVVRGIVDQARASGAGFFGKRGAQLKAAFAIGQRYCAMAPEAILAETPGNWALWPGSRLPQDHHRGGGGQGHLRHRGR